MRDHGAIVSFGSIADSPRYLPRKGTETVRMINIVITFNITQFATIFTPQGDGNGKANAAAIESSKYSPRYLPRKGTETLVNSLSTWATLNCIRHDIYPARGRKPVIPSICVVSVFFKLSNSPRYLPRKGTETPLKPPH